MGKNPLEKDFDSEQILLKMYLCIKETKNPNNKLNKTQVLLWSS